jgi:Zn-dependent protease with chaperone function
MYSTFMLWMLSELYELLPEQGDLDKPRMVFFFDEAHLLFDDCPKSLLEKVEQVVRLIRSKGVGVYFITQNPSDIPASVLGQLGMGSNTMSIVQAIAAQGFNFRNLSYSRSHESEADHMGLIFAAMAGYNPQVATTFWQRMAAQGSGSSSIFSDHPSDATRIRQIQQWMPEALKYYKPVTTTTSAKKASTKKTTTKKTTTTAKKKK